MRTRTGFTLIELLVVVGIIGVLVALLLPAVQMVREAANRAKCANNFKQLGIALHHYHDVCGSFPPALDDRVNPLHRWSAHTRLLPYLEQTNLYNSLDLVGPLFQDNALTVAAGNVPGVSQVVPVFLCPSDWATPFVPVSAQDPNTLFGPTNYMACVGSGAKGGTRTNADGMIFTDSAVRFADVRDGTSTTALMSESLLGKGGPELFQTPTPQDAARTYAYLYTQQALDADACGKPLYWETNSNSKWADGQAYCTLYDHFYPPNAPQWDCVSYTSNWRAARSRHGGGVNLLLVDGSVRFVDNGINLDTWHALGSRAGGEIIGAY